LRYWWVNQNQTIRPEIARPAPDLEIWSSIARMLRMARGLSKGERSG
jgi:hypothetical protein